MLRQWVVGAGDSQYRRKLQSLPKWNSLRRHGARFLRKLAWGRQGLSTQCEDIILLLRLSWRRRVARRDGGRVLTDEVGGAAAGHGLSLRYSHRRDLPALLYVR